MLTGTGTCRRLLDESGIHHGAEKKADMAAVTGGHSKHLPLGKKDAPAKKTGQTVAPVGTVAQGKTPEEHKGLGEKIKGEFS